MAIVTHRFRKNNVQNLFDEMTLPKVIISGCASSGTVVTPSPAYIPSNLQVGMAVILTGGTGGINTVTSSTGITIVTSVSSTSFSIYPAPTVALSGATLNFYNQYYIGIGKGDPYNGGLDGSDATPGTPVPTRKYENDVRNNLIALQKVIVALTTGSAMNQSAIYGNAGYVLPAYSWSSGNFYKAWDPTDSSCFYPTAINGGTITGYPCYATYNSGSGTKVYVCVSNGPAVGDGFISSASTFAPSTNVGAIGVVGSSSGDGYQWTYISDLGLDTSGTLVAQGLTTTASSSSLLDSNQFFKIYRRATTTGTSSTIATPSTASAGVIYSLRLVSGGTGFTTASTFVIDGDGTTTASGIVLSTNSAGAITSIAITSSGAGYTTGVVRFTNAAGSNAIIFPRITPASGFGYDNVADLPAWYAGFYSNFGYDTNYPGAADIPSNDQLRQISLVKNPVVFTSTSGSSITYRCLKYLTVNTNSTGVSPGDVVQSTVNTARGYVDAIVALSTTSQLYYHQNSSTFGSNGLYLTPIPFTTGSYQYYTKASGYVTLTSGSGTITTTSFAPNGQTGSDEFVAGTGEIIFIQNRAPITQALGQTEAITLVAQF